MIIRGVRVTKDRTGHVANFIGTGSLINQVAADSFARVYSFYAAGFIYCAGETVALKQIARSARVTGAPVNHQRPLYYRDRRVSHVREHELYYLLDRH